jgi:hypothetical protein
VARDIAREKANLGKQVQKFSQLSAILARDRRRTEPSRTGPQINTAEQGA